MFGSKLGDIDSEKVGFNVKLFVERDVGDELGCSDVGKSVGTRVEFKISISLGCSLGKTVGSQFEG